MGARHIAILSLILAASAAHSQTYRCGSGAAASLSDRPCGTSTQDRILAHDPTRATDTLPFSAQLPGAPKAQDHVKYLSDDCASVSEAIRNGLTRGVRDDVIQGWHEVYRQMCSLEDQDARARVQQDHAQEQRSKFGQRDGAMHERQQASLQADQCVGMLDVVALKRKRESQLNGTEVEALRGLERSYNERCISR